MAPEETGRLEHGPVESDACIHGGVAPLWRQDSSQACGIDKIGVWRARELTMFRIDAQKPVHLCDGVSRRGFFHAGGLSLAAPRMPSFMEMPAHGALRSPNDINRTIIFLLW